MKLLTWLFLTTGIFALVFALYQIILRETPSRLAFNSYSYGKTIVHDGKEIPQGVSIPSLGIDVPVYPAQVTDNVWQTTESGASYLVSSPLPGESGNSVVYAHNWKSLFGNLTKARVGEYVIVRYPDGTKKTFVIAYTSVVKPDESTILAPSQDKRLTLYTCTGFLDRERFVAVAILKS